MSDPKRYIWTRITFEGHCRGCGQSLSEEWVSKVSPNYRWVRCGREYGCGTVTLLEKTNTDSANCTREGIAPPREKEKTEGEA